MKSDLWRGFWLYAGYVLFFGAVLVLLLRVDEPIWIRVIGICLGGAVMFFAYLLMRAIGPRLGDRSKRGCGDSDDSDSSGESS